MDFEFFKVTMSFIPAGKKKGQKSDEELLKEFTQTGDLAVLGELYSGYMHLVYGVCLKHFKDREESRDAVMQIFEKLITEIPKQNIMNFRNWLHVVTKNYCLMQLRSQKAGSEKAAEWSIAFMEINNELHPIDNEEINLDKALEDCIEKLNGEQKECIRRFYFGNSCYNEIALKMNLNEKKVKSHLQNAKRNLKLCLEAKHVRQEY
jgi:RNA polymerase sigma-70 factor (ECF subfamily)